LGFIPKKGFNMKGNNDEKESTIKTLAKYLKDIGAKNVKVTTMDEIEQNIEKASPADRRMLIKAINTKS